MHGTADRVVPHTMSDQLYEAAHNVTPGLKRLVKIEGASHSARSAAARNETAVGAFMRDASRAYGRKQG